MPDEHEHLLYDIWLPDGEILKYIEPLRGIVVDAARRGGANIYHQHWHQFEPWGVTGFLLLKESHISIHTWPEEGNFAAVDIFPCGPMDVDLIVHLLREALRPIRERVLREVRGAGTGKKDGEAGTSDPLEEATQRLSQDRHHLQALVDRAEAHLGRRDFKAALQDIGGCLEIARDEPGLRGELRAALLARLYTMQAGALAGLENWQDAYRAVQLALREGPDDAETIVQRGRIRLELGDPAGALQDFEHALTLDSSSAGAHLARGTVRSRLQDYQGALQDYDRAIQLDRSLAAAWSHRGQVHFALDNLHQAERDCRTALEMDPQLLPAYDVLAGCLLCQKRPDEALDVVAEGLRRHPGDATLRLRAARIYVEQELFPRAFAVLNIVLGQSPDRSEAYGLRGSLHIRRGDYTAAIADLRRAIQLDPQTATYYADLALAYRHMGELAAALGCLQEVLRLRPGDVEARALYHQLSHQEQDRHTAESPADERPAKGFGTETQEGTL